MHLKQSGKGFTLVELLVVISIIGMLSSIVLASLNTARAKARDAKRVADFQQMQLALQMYRIQNGAYPTSPNGCCSGGAGGTHNQSFEAVAQALVSANTLAAVPRDPLHGSSYAYMLYNYGGSIGPLMVTYLEAAAPTTEGYPGTCRPWGPNLNWCGQDLTTYYCLCNP